MLKGEEISQHLYENELALVHGTKNALFDKSSPLGAAVLSSPI